MRRRSSRPSSKRTWLSRRRRQIFRRRRSSAAEERVEDTLLGRAESIIAKTAERTTDLIDKTQEQLDPAGRERTEALVNAAAKTLKKIVQMSRTGS